MLRLASENGRLQREGGHSSGRQLSLNCWLEVSSQGLPFGDYLLALQITQRLKLASLASSADEHSETH